MLKKLYDKDEVWFAVGWIILYVLAFGNADSLSENLGTAKVLTIPVGIVLSIVLWGFLRRNGLSHAVGLCPVSGSWQQFLWFVPLMIISTVNFWYGLTCNEPPLETVLYILSMCCVGFLEEVIFRGLLFTGMAKSNLKAAIIVSSLTFGMGHIVNLLFGAPVFDTLLQLVYASAIGFCYTALFLVSGSILPCIASYIFVNTTSIFAPEPSATAHILITIIQTILSTGYGLWLLKHNKGASIYESND